MENLIQAAFKTQLGNFKIKLNDSQIFSVEFVNQNFKTEKISNPLLKECRDQLDAFFAKKLFKFDLPLAINQQGTDFQRAVWQAIAKIPYGKTLSYQDIAHKIDNAKAVRAVGNACNKNPYCIVVPCHRVVSSSGLGGYAHGSKMKLWLFDLEEISI